MLAANAHFFWSTLEANKKCLPAEFGQWPLVRNFLFWHYFPSFLPSFNKYLFDGCYVGGTVLCTGDRAINKQEKERLSWCSLHSGEPSRIIHTTVFIEQFWPMHCTWRVEKNVRGPCPHSTYVLGGRKTIITNAKYRYGERCNLDGGEWLGKSSWRNWKDT